MKGLKTLLAASLTTLGLSVAALPVSAAEAPVHFADLNWESGSLITEVLRVIVEKGYDLPTDTFAWHHHHPGNRPGEERHPSDR